MAGQRTIYNLRRIRQDYTYTTQEVAETLGTCEHTVLRWLKEGLQALPDTRPYLFHSSELLRFLSRRQAKRKTPCQAHEMYCLKCRSPRQVAAGGVGNQLLPNNSMRLTGPCQVCGTRINKLIKASSWTAEHPLYPSIKLVSEQHDGVQQPQPTCSVDKEGQLCLKLTH